LLSKIGTRHFLDPFLLCSTQHCQVYGGVKPEDPRTTRAVADTRGQVLLRDGGGLVEAYYSASCGGLGEANENVWGTPGAASTRSAPTPRRSSPSPPASRTTTSRPSSPPASAPSAAGRSTPRAGTAGPCRWRAPSSTAWSPPSTRRSAMSRR